MMKIVVEIRKILKIGVEIKKILKLVVELDNILEGEASEDKVGGAEGDGEQGENWVQSGSSGRLKRYKSPAASYLTGKSAKGGL